MDPYKVLGISHTATEGEIKQAYRRLALEVHPDVNKSTEATALFRQLNTAYETIMSSRITSNGSQHPTSASRRRRTPASPTGQSTQRDPRSHGTSRPDESRSAERKIQAERDFNAAMQRATVMREQAQADRLREKGASSQKYRDRIQDLQNARLANEAELRERRSAAQNDRIMQIAQVERELRSKLDAIQHERDNALRSAQQARSDADQTFNRESTEIDRLHVERMRAVDAELAAARSRRDS
jgi:curved DNA-binding protein CbpA